MRVLTIGTFDILHWGHIDFLNRCKELGDVTVGVNSDDFVIEFKGSSPVMTLDERQHTIESFGIYTVVNRTPGKDIIERINPDILVVGSDWARKDYLKQIDVTQDWLDEHNIILAYIPRVQWKPISTTEIKRRVREQN